MRGFSRSHVMSREKFLPPLSVFEAVRARLRLVRRTLSVGLFSLAVGIATHTLFPLLRWLQRRRIARGETIWLDDQLGPRPRQRFRGLPPVPADLSPRTGRDRKARHMRLAEYPSTRYAFAYRRPPISGNVINGLGETRRRRAKHVFFGDGYRRAWGQLDWYFQVMEPTANHRVITRLFWQDRRRLGPVAGRRVAADPGEMSARIKRAARERGAALVGITRLTDEMRYEGFETPFVYAISVAVPMDRETMLYTPSDRSSLEIMRMYSDVNRVAIELAAHIRGLGWPARASTNISPDASVEVLHLPIAIAAGLGELGKHGSIITPELGSNLRLATVLTDLPLEIDTPREVGVDDFCASCRICESNCPPHAILPAKQLVRGVRRWYVDFDKCVPYFAKTAGCGICIQVCPWSEPGRGLPLAERLRARRARAS